MFMRCIAGVWLAMAASSAQAGAWAQPKGKGQIILKAEVMRASEGYDAFGTRRALPERRVDHLAGFFGEYGLSDRLTVQLKGDWQSGEEAFLRYKGRGPTELGLTWQAYRDNRSAVSIYAGFSVGGEGRNAGYGAPGAGDEDVEIRISAGRSFNDGREGARSTIRPERTFIEVQAARRARSGLPDESRLDLTVGSHFGRGWLLLGQAFGGAVDGGGPTWVSVETSLVRNLGPWSLQAGWRTTAAGRETPVSEGAVLAMWYRF